MNQPFDAATLKSHSMQSFRGNSTFLQAFLSHTTLRRKKKRKMKRLKYQKVPFFESQTHSAAAQPVSVVTASHPSTGYPGITVVCCHVVCYYY
jgi:hypothetical protein